MLPRFRGQWDLGGLAPTFNRFAGTRHRESELTLFLVGTSHNEYVRCDWDFCRVSYRVEFLLIIIRSFFVMNQTQPEYKQVWTNDEGTMAWETARSRWANTIQNMADDLKSSLSGASPEQRAEGELLLSRLLGLKEDVEQDKPIR